MISMTSDSSKGVLIDRLWDIAAVHGGVAECRLTPRADIRSGDGAMTSTANSSTGNIPAGGMIGTRDWLNFAAKLSKRAGPPRYLGPMDFGR
jgi:hypothetical protein